MRQKTYLGRFSPEDISLARMVNAVRFRMNEFPNSLAWRFSRTAKQNRERLSSLKDVHRGERCFILANGPSLARTDLSPLANEITFGMNRIYLLFDRMPFVPTYYASINGLVISQFAHEIERLTMPKFLNWSMRSAFASPDESYLFLKLSQNPIVSFKNSLTSPLSVGGTVTYTCLQIAFFLGFERVYLVGLDHHYDSHGASNEAQVREEATDTNHFSPDYFPKGVKWHTPDLKHSEHAYRIARRHYERTGRKILDATLGGHCPVFEKAAYDDLFKGSQ